MINLTLFERLILLKEYRVLESIDPAKAHEHALDGQRVKNGRPQDFADLFAVLDTSLDLGLGREPASMPVMTPVQRLMLLNELRILEIVDPQNGRKYDHEAMAIELGHPDEMAGLFDILDPAAAPRLKLVPQTAATDQSDTPETVDPADFCVTLVPIEPSEAALALERKIAELFADIGAVG